MSAVQEHLKSKMKHVAKFAAFVKNNADFPFWVKKKVMNAALFSAIMYGCESWTCGSAKLLRPTYITVVKTLLGVRQQTANDLCLLEVGLPDVVARIKMIQKNFMQKILCDRRDLADDPFMSIWKICCDRNTPAVKYFHAILTGPDPVKEDTTRRQTSVRASARPKFMTYVDLNPSLSVNRIYTDRAVMEHQRIYTTRFRLSAHNLAIETGRWSRIPREERLCQCGTGVQTEEHVIIQCPLTAQWRPECVNLDSYFQLQEACEKTWTILKYFEQ